MSAVTVYSTPNCQGCRATKRKLDAAQIPYQEVTASDSMELTETIKARAAELGTPAAMPYVTIYDESNNLIADWFAFRPDLINQHLIN